MKIQIIYRCSNCGRTYKEVNEFSNLIEAVDSYYLEDGFDETIWNSNERNHQCINGTFGVMRIVGFKPIKSANWFIKIFSRRK